MPRPRFFKLSDDKRSRILDEAFAEFAAYGFEQASYNRIIEAAQISKGAMYYYFDDKADLYVTVIERLMEEQLSGLESLRPEAALDAAGFWQEMREVSVSSVEQLLARPELAQLSRGFLDLEPGTLGERGEEIRRRRAELTRSWLTAGQRAGAVRTDLPLELLLALTVTMEGFFDRWWLNHFEEADGAERDELIEVTLDITRRLLEPASRGGE